MTLEIILFIAIAAFISNIISLWAFGYAVRSHKHRILEMYNRLNYLEVSMSYHELIPLPWEMDEFTDSPDERKSFKHEGNVVYLQQED